MQDRILKSEKIDWKQIQTLQPDNFKLPEQQEVLKKSLLANGFVSPFCVWQDEAGVIWSIDGVHRIKALTELQEQGQDIPELLTANFIEAKDRKEAGIILLEVFNTKQNKATEQGLELLKIDLNISNDDLHVDLSDLDIKIELEEPEVTELETAEAPDEAPEPPTIPITAKGDLYELNGHRVLCGDSTVVDDVDKLMQGEKADFLFTDPPYGINMSKGFSGAGGFDKPIARREYQDNWDNVRPTQECFALLLSFAEHAIIWGGNYFSDILPQGQHWLVWNKNNTMPTFSDCELAWTNIDRKSVKKYDLTYNGLIGKEAERFHPTQKPVKLFQMIFDDYNFTTVLDAFLGSGSTLIAAEQTNRRCYGIELEEKYCDVIVTRWVKMMKENKKEYVVKRNGEVINWEI
jgi:DNA modification methylase